MRRTARAGDRRRSGFFPLGAPYVENAVIAGLLSFPWLLSKRRAPCPDETSRSALSWRAFALPAILMPVIATGGRAPLGPLQVGAVLNDGWALERIEARRHEARVSLRRNTQRVVLVLSLKSPQHGPGPFSAGGVDISYRTTSIDFHAFEAPARLVVSELQAAAGKDGLRAALKGWLADSAR